MYGQLMQIARYLLLRLASLAVLFTMFPSQGCIKEDMTDCVTEEWLLYVKVVDIATGSDITASGEVDNIVINIFDSENWFVASYSMSALQIREREPVRIKNSGKSRLIVSAWGALDDNVAVSETGEGSILRESTVTLLPNPVAEEYDRFPGDYFFGLKEIISGNELSRTEEIVITQKNAKLNVTVRGLDHSTPEYYYFKISHNYSGYDFSGTPLVHSSYLKTQGEFNDSGEYITREPCILIHSDYDGLPSDENSAWVGLFDGEREIAGTNKDSNGNYISLLSGLTTNVLLDLDEDGRISVYIKITPWDEIYLWPEY
ncbi:MAG: FimB/Mfa2 family fimbrial subunit [Rikenellaceae bacterium]|nr:FimB/Mfa2 family fimbrial subunit [Rikenellaceae bacterium]